MTFDLVTEEAAGGFRREAVEAAEGTPPLHGSEVGVAGQNVAHVDRRAAVGVEAALELGDVDGAHVGGGAGGEGEMRGVAGGLAEGGPDGSRRSAQKPTWVALTGTGARRLRTSRPAVTHEGFGEGAIAAGL